jgi:hypothetical protein
MFGLTTLISLGDFRPPPGLDSCAATVSAPKRFAFPAPAHFVVQLLRSLITRTVLQLLRSSFEFSH